MIGAEREELMEISVMLTSHWVTRAGEGRAYHKIGYGYFSLEQFENAVDNFVSAVDAFNTMRSYLESNDECKINFRGLYEETYTP